MHLWQISVVCLAIVAVLCVVGALHPAYQDNFVQRAGMALLAFGAASRVQAISISQFVANDWWLVHVGVCLYACGTAWKQYRAARGAREPQ